MSKSRLLWCRTQCTEIQVSLTTPVNKTPASRKILENMEHLFAFGEHTVSERQSQLSTLLDVMTTPMCIVLQRSSKS